MGDLSRLKTRRFFFIGLIVMGDLPIIERYDDFFQVGLILIDDLSR
jgi:hypothetical protein